MHTDGINLHYLVLPGFDLLTRTLGLVGLRLRSQKVKPCQVSHSNVIFITKLIFETDIYTSVKFQISYHTISIQYPLIDKTPNI